MARRRHLYEGKAKQIYSTDNPNEVLIHYKDDATAGNGAKKAQFEDKGVLNAAISTMIFDYLIVNGIKTHLIKKVFRNSFYKIKKTTTNKLAIRLKKNIYAHN